MNLASISLIQSSYFFIFLFSIIVLFDVLIRFTSPIRLKIFFLLFVLAIVVSSFCLFIRSVPDQLILIRMICPNRIQPPPSIRDCQCFALSSQECSLPKAFQKQTSFAFGFFNAHPLNQASLFRGFALKKPLTL